jgi:aspartate racemase
MKTIGLIGGLSWESSIEYYRIINEYARQKLGGLHSAKSLLYTFDFEEIERLQSQNRWEEATAMMVDAAQRLERGGADFLIICSNTMHRMTGQVQESTSIPLLHIADATAARIKAAGIRKIGLLGTAYTMEQDFYKGRLRDRYGLEVVVPGSEARGMVHRVIYEELCRGIMRPESRDEYRHIIKGLVEQDATGIIFGCTEIGLLVGPDDSPVPVFDTTRIHAEAAVEYALAE